MVYKLLLSLKPLVVEVLRLMLKSTDGLKSIGN